MGESYTIQPGDLPTTPDTSASRHTNTYDCPVNHRIDALGTGPIDPSVHIPNGTFARTLLLLKQSDPQHVEHVVETPVECQVCRHDGHKDIDADREPELRLHRVGGRPVERRDPHVLRDPSADPLYLPATRVEVDDRHGGERDAVGEEGEPLAGLGVDSQILLAESLPDCSLSFARLRVARTTKNAPC